METAYLDESGVRCQLCGTCFSRKGRPKTCQSFSVLKEKKRRNNRCPNSHRTSIRILTQISNRISPRGSHLCSSLSISHRRNAVPGCGLPLPSSPCCSSPALVWVRLHCGEQ